MPTLAPSSKGSFRSLPALYLDSLQDGGRSGRNRQTTECPGGGDANLGDPVVQQLQEPVGGWLVPHPSDNHSRLLAPRGPPAFSMRTAACPTGSASAGTSAKPIRYSRTEIRRSRCGSSSSKPNRATAAGVRCWASTRAASRRRPESLLSAKRSSKGSNRLGLISASRPPATAATAGSGSVTSRSKSVSDSEPRWCVNRVAATRRSMVSREPCAIRQTERVRFQLRRLKGRQGPRSFQTHASPCLGVQRQAAQVGYGVG